MTGITRRRFLESAALGAVSIATGASARAMADRRGASAGEYMRHDALGLAQLVAKGEVTPSELLEAAIARTEAVNPKLNAVVLPHFERARAAVSGSLAQGPFRGVPFLLKDLFTALEGTVTTHGSRFFADSVEPHSDLLVSRYEAAGLVIFGKTASPEFGAAGTTESLQWGDTHNPWKRGYSAGGSSGGTAAAVAAGIVPVGHASDAGGSIRIPASCCGLFGLKPSRGRVLPGPDGIDRSAGLATDHVISRSVRDSAALLDLTSLPMPGVYSPARTPRRPFLAEVGADPGTLRIGLQTRSFMLSELHPDCSKAALETAKQCEGLGHVIEEIAPPPLSAEEVFAGFPILLDAYTSEVIQARERVLGRAVTPDDLEPHNWTSHQNALAFGALQYERALHASRSFAGRVIRHQRAYDLVLSPTLAAPPPPHGSLRADYETYMAAGLAASAFTLQYNVSGQPAMSVPLHWNDDGLPVGVMFAAAPGREDLLLRLAAQLEAAHPWASRRPPL